MAHDRAKTSPTAHADAGSPAAAAPGSLAAASRGADRALDLVLLASLVLLGLGLTQPVMHVTRLFVFTDRFSILQGIAMLFDAGEVLLAAVVGLFSVVFPLAKLVCAAWLWRGPAPGSRAHRRAARWVEGLGRWSMLDVMVAALLVVSIKTSVIADATTEPGLYLFLASVLLAMFATWRIRRAATRLGGRDG